MATLTHYRTDKGNSQHELQVLAKDILEYGEIVGESQHRRTTIDPGQEPMSVASGSKCYEVKGFGQRYWVHLNGLRVTEIIEESRA